MKSRKEYRPLINSQVSAISKSSHQNISQPINAMTVFAASIICANIVQNLRRPLKFDDHFSNVISCMTYWPAFKFAGQLREANKLASSARYMKRLKYRKSLINIKSNNHLRNEIVTRNINIRNLNVKV